MNSIQILEAFKPMINGGLSIDRVLEQVDRHFSHGQTSSNIVSSAKNLLISYSTARSQAVVCA